MDRRGNVVGGPGSAIETARHVGGYLVDVASSHARATVDTATGVAHNLIRQLAHRNGASLKSPLQPENEAADKDESNCLQ